MKKRNIEMDWHEKLGIKKLSSDCAYEEFYKTNSPEGVQAVRLTHKEYAFKFSSHELDRVDVEKLLEHIEKLFVTVELEWFGVDSFYNYLRFAGKLSPYSLKDIQKQIDKDYPIERLDRAILDMAKLNPNIVFCDRIGWEIAHIPKHFMMAIDDDHWCTTGESKNRKRTPEEFEFNARAYRRFSVGAVPN